MHFPAAWCDHVTFVSHITLLPSVPTMHYPAARPPRQRLARSKPQRAGQLVECAGQHTVSCSSLGQAALVAACSASMHFVHSVRHSTCVPLTAGAPCIDASPGFPLCPLLITARYGSPAWQLLPELHREPGDHVITSKRTYDAFQVRIAWQKEWAGRLHAPEVQALPLWTFDVAWRHSARQEGRQQWA